MFHQEVGAPHLAGLAGAVPAAAAGPLPLAGVGDVVEVIDAAWGHREGLRSGDRLRPQLLSATSSFWPQQSASNPQKQLAPPPEPASGPAIGFLAFTNQLLPPTINILSPQKQLLAPHSALPSSSLGLEGPAGWILGVLGHIPSMSSTARGRHKTSHLCHSPRSVPIAHHRLWCRSRFQPFQSLTNPPPTRAGTGNTPRQHRATAGKGNASFLTWGRALSPSSPCFYCIIHPQSSPIEAGADQIQAESSKGPNSRLQSQATASS